MSAGTEINYVSNGSACTQGPAVRYNSGAWGFMTNSHCTGDFFDVTGREFHQPTVSPASPRGVETDEPEYRNVWGGFLHTSGFYSDAAFIRSTNGVQLQGKAVAAERCSIGASNCYENGAVYNIVGTGSAYVNMFIAKTGRTTGSTAGRIDRTCEDLGGNPLILCQAVAKWTSSTGTPQPTTSYPLAYFGDSGSPVVSYSGIPGSGAANAALIGMLWGGDTTIPDEYWFSPWENMTTAGIAGTQYGLPIAAVTSSQGAVSNTSGGGGGGGGGGDDCLGGFEVPAPGC